MSVNVAGGQNALAWYYVAGVRQWYTGCNTAGTYVVVDATVGVARFYIDTGGAVSNPGALSVGGTLTVAGTSNLAGINFSGRFRSTVAGARTWDFGCGASGEFRIDDDSAGANRVYIDTAGTVTLQQSCTVAVNLQVNGQFTAAGASSFGSTLQVNSNLIVIGAVYPSATAAGSAYILYQSGNSRILQYQSGWFWSWDVPTGTLLWNNGTGAGQNVQFSPNGNTVNKNGNWLTWSDLRIKQDIEDYQAGLKEICALRPRRFRFKAEADGPLYYGLVAQEAEDIMPEMIEKIQHSRDGVDYDDFRTLNSGPVLWALVNAVRELAGEVAALKARPA
jgi:hypothetical protein